MKKNRKISKTHSVMISMTMQFGGVLLVLLAVVVTYLMVTANCAQLSNSIGKSENELKRLEEDYQRELGRWQEMITPEKLEVALLRRGLAMRLPRPEQIIRMDSKGQVRPGQVSVAQAKKRQGKLVSTLSTRSR